MTNVSDVHRPLQVLWHDDLSRADLPELGWWLADVPAERRADLGRLRCAQLRIDVQPVAANDWPFPAAQARLGAAALSIISSGELGAATIIVTSSPARPSRVRTHKGPFWGRPALRAGPRLEIEVPASGGETCLVGLAPLTEESGYADVAAGAWAAVLLHPQPADERYWQAVASDIATAHAQAAGFAGLATWLVGGSTAWLTQSYLSDRALSACLFYDVVHEGAARWAVEQAELGASAPVT